MNILLMTKLCIYCYRLEPSIGDTADFPGSSCKDILESHSSNCFRPATDGPYWVRVTDQCSGVEQTMQVMSVTDDLIKGSHDTCVL